MTMEAESAPAGTSRSPPPPPPPPPPPEAVEEGDTAKPLMVRIKRKRLQPPIESLWLEVFERPTKRLEAELLSFSLNDSDSHNPDSGKAMEGKPTRLLFHHLDTVTSFGMEETTRVNTLFREFHNETSKERHRSSVKSKDQRGKYLTTAREKYQALANKARFEQVWRSRKGAKKLDTMSELFHLYDIVRVDVDSEAIERHQRKEQAKRAAELAESQLLQNFLPLFKEYLPTVATEVESSSTTLPMNEDEYVYDVYYLEGGADGNEADMPDFPMVQVVDDDDFRWGLSSESEYDSEDSNDENNPMNDYPEEEEDSELSLDAENDTSQSGLEVEDEQQSTKSDGSDVLEESEDYWDNSGYDSAEEERYGN